MATIWSFRRSVNLGRTPLKSYVLYEKFIEIAQQLKWFQRRDRVKNMISTQVHTDIRQVYYSFSSGGKELYNLKISPCRVILFCVFSDKIMVGLRIFLEANIQYIHVVYISMMNVIAPQRAKTSKRINCSHSHTAEALRKAQSVSAMSTSICWLLATISLYQNAS